ncbi:MAG: hypothetical protein WB763_08200, partial [Terriglobia bacterium]
MKDNACTARESVTTDPSPVPRRLVKAPVAGHPLPRGEGFYFLHSPLSRRERNDPIPAGGADIDFYVGAPEQSRLNVGGADIKGNVCATPKSEIQPSPLGRG